MLFSSCAGRSARPALVWSRKLHSAAVLGQAEGEIPISVQFGEQVIAIGVDCPKELTEIVGQLCGSPSADRSRRDREIDQFLNGPSFAAMAPFVWQIRAAPIEIAG